MLIKKTHKNTCQNGPNLSVTYVAIKLIRRATSAHTSRINMMTKKKLAHLKS